MDRSSTDSDTGTIRRVTYWSLGVDGAPFSVRYPAKSLAEEAAAKTFKAYPDVTELEILEVTVLVRKKLSRLPDLFGGL